jgi:hypothetical protein
MEGFMATKNISRPGSARLKFHAVSIVPGKQCCGQVQALQGVRLLSAEAPRLPIVGCTMAQQCQCRYQHHEDRRGPSRRSGLHSPKTSQWEHTGGDRRRAVGRRDSDYLEG